MTCYKTEIKWERIKEYILHFWKLLLTLNKGEGGKLTHSQEIADIINIASSTCPRLFSAVIFWSILLLVNIVGLQTEQGLWFDLFCYWAFEFIKLYISYQPKLYNIYTSTRCQLSLCLQRCRLSHWKNSLYNCGVFYETVRWIGA